MTASSTLPTQTSRYDSHLTEVVSSLTVLTEIFLDLLGRGVLTDSPNEDLPALGLLALGLGSGRLGVDLLAVQDVGGEREDPLQGGGAGEGDEAKPAAPLERQKLTR